jgi:hypothetical protein
MAGDKSALNTRWVTVVCLILLPLAVGCTQTASPSIEVTDAEPSASPTTTLHVGTMAVGRSQGRWYSQSASQLLRAPASGS